MKNKIILSDIESILSNASVDWSRFKGATILVTGANGFLPAYMIEVILHLNECIFSSDQQAKVIALVRNYERGRDRFLKSGDRPGLSFLVQDVVDPIEVDGPIDFIIHAASQASPKYYGSDPVGTILANVLGAHRTLELARIKNAEYLFFSSGEVYGEVDGKKPLVSEIDFGYLDPTKVRSCYGEGKRAGETMSVSYASQYGLKVKIVRPFHTYGPCMPLNDGRVFVDFVSNIVKRENVILKSDGMAIRPFCYIADAVAGFFSVMLNGENAIAYNIGNPYQTIKVGDLAQLLVQLFPERGLSVVRAGAPIERGYLTSPVVMCIPDIGRAKQLGWSPSTSIPDGFRRTVESYCL